MFKKKIFKKDIAIYCDTEDKIKSAENYFIANGYEFSQLYKFVSNFTKGFKLKFCIQPLPKSKKIYCGAISTFLSTDSKIIPFEKALKKSYQWNEEQGKVVSHTDKVEEKQEDFAYPIFAKSKVSGSIYKFTDTKTNIRVFGSNPTVIGLTTDTSMPHTDAERWLILDYDADRSLYDGQPVWCWNDHHECKRELRFYDAKNMTVFTYFGTRNGSAHDNYEPLTLEEIKALQPMLSEMYKELKYD
ncbi:hypothetical protein [Francisella marina]|uniref:Uncharacterized protein n=1 Tax=Francisella marina TaxID=2249302 RepID=A0ABX5ZHU2_9GAMM|nr:hypothetical protein [Francisella marina]QEO57581.1 hypothetical protein F0R74_06835 [Francisella marina]